MSRANPRFHLLPLLAALALLPGCAYIHFGRIDKAHLDAKLAEENSDLRVEKKLLQQELEIARKENGTLRLAVERQPTPAGTGDLVAKLNETTRELSALRADYARLQAERLKLDGTKGGNETTEAKVEALAQVAEIKAKLADNEDRLASTLKLYTQLQEENNKLRASVDQTQAENAALTKQLAQSGAQFDEARQALTQLNTELLAQKQARSRAEQDAQALRAQLRTLIEHSRVEPAPAGTLPSLAAAREGTASGAAELSGPGHAEAAPPVLIANADKTPGAHAAAPRPTPPPAAGASPAAARTYVVQAGDTLEQLAEKFYGRRDKWQLIYAANNAQLSGGRPLRPGMELEIPAEE